MPRLYLRGVERTLVLDWTNFTYLQNIYAQRDFRAILSETGSRAGGSYRVLTMKTRANNPLTVNATSSAEDLVQSTIVAWHDFPRGSTSGSTKDLEISMDDCKSYQSDNIYNK